MTMHRTPIYDPRTKTVRWVTSVDSAAFMRSRMDQPPVLHPSIAARAVEAMVVHSRPSTPNSD
jgi:hypothetical protein